MLSILDQESFKAAITWLSCIQSCILPWPCYSCSWQTRANHDLGMSGLAMEWSLYPPALSPAPSEGGIGSSVMAEAQVMRATRRVQRHHSPGAAGGDVILGGFVMALVVVLCYLRITRKSKETDHVWESKFWVIHLWFYSRCREQNRPAIVIGIQNGHQKASARMVLVHHIIDVTLVRFRMIGSSSDSIILKPHWSLYEVFSWGDAV